MRDGHDHEASPIAPVNRSMGSDQPTTSSISFALSGALKKCGNASSTSWRLLDVVFTRVVEAAQDAAASIFCPNFTARITPTAAVDRIVPWYRVPRRSWTTPGRYYSASNRADETGRAGN